MSSKDSKSNRFRFSNETGALLVGIQATALIAAIAINLIGLAYGLNLYLPSVPFFIMSFALPTLVRLGRHKPTSTATQETAKK